MSYSHRDSERSQPNRLPGPSLAERAFDGKVWKGQSADLLRSTLGQATTVDDTSKSETGITCRNYFPKGHEYGLTVILENDVVVGWQTADWFASEAASQEWLRIKELVSLAWILYRSNAVGIMAVVLVVHLPLNILMETETYLTLVGQSQTITTTVADFAVELVSAIATMAIAYLIHAAITGKGMTWHRALGQAASRWLDYAVASIVLSFIVGFLLLLLIIPGVIWLVYYSFVTYVVALRNEGGKSALDYSKELVQDNWWKVLGYVLTFFGIVLLLSIPIEVLSVFLPDISEIRVFLTLLTDIVWSFFAVLMTLFFLDLDTLKRRPHELSAPRTYLRQWLANE